MRDHALGKGRGGGIECGGVHRVDERPPAAAERAAQGELGGVSAG
ncbi:hypothetical protein [Sphingomonas quercus]